MTNFRITFCHHVNWMINLEAENLVSDIEYADDPWVQE